MTIALVFGGIGSFKTALLADWSMDALYNGFPVWSNFKMGYKDKVGLDGVVTEPFPNFFPIRISQLLTKEIQRGFVPVTEAYTLAESRVSTSKLVRFSSYFAFQSRKHEVDVAMDAQLESSIDLRWVALAELIVLAEGLNEDDGRVYYTFYHGGVKPFTERRWISYDYFRLNVFPYYESYEKVNPVNYKDLSTEMDRFDNKVWNEKIDDVCRLFEGKYGEYGIRSERDLQKYLVNDFVTQEGEADCLVAPVFDRLRSRLRKCRVVSM